MKALLFSALLLFTSYAQALTFSELVDQTQGSAYLGMAPCFIEAPPATHMCVEFQYQEVKYRAAVQPKTSEVDFIFTTKSELFPEGEVPLDYFIYAGSI